MKFSTKLLKQKSDEMLIEHTKHYDEEVKRAVKGFRHHKYAEIESKQHHAEMKKRGLE